MTKKPTTDYPGASVDVRWDERLCLHMGECGRANNELFINGRDPWCQPDLVSVEDVVEVVGRCPTGALTVIRGPQEEADRRNSLMVANDGPLYFRGRLEIAGAPDDMEGVRFRAALCRCGRSKNKPFCDNSHEAARFRDHGAVGETGPGLEAEGGPLSIEPTKNGPLMVKGNLTIMAGTGRVAWHGTEAFLCRCGQSKNKPFCDGSHEAAGFQSE